MSEISPSSTSARVDGRCVDESSCGTFSSVFHELGGGGGSREPGWAVSVFEPTPPARRCLCDLGGGADGYVCLINGYPDSLQGSLK